MSIPPIDSPVTERGVTSLDGTDLHVLDAGSGPLVVLVHGFPELSHSWRHQIPALVGAGYRVLVPDMRGYGRSAQPEAVEAYDIVHLTDDLVALLDDAGEDRAVFVGHDWGALVVWSMAQRHPERVAGVVGMSVPFSPRSSVPPTQLFRQLVGDAFFYILYFQEPGVADADLARDPATTMRRFMAGLSGEADAEKLAQLVGADDGRGFVDRLPEPDGLPAWLSTEDLAHYVETFTRTGYTGGVNWYRNLDRNWALSEHLHGAKVEQPALFVSGAGDPVLIMSPPEVMNGWVTDLRGTVIIPGAGHWVQQEAPGAVNEAMVAFLKGLDTW